MKPTTLPQTIPALLPTPAAPVIAVSAIASSTSSLTPNPSALAPTETPDDALLLRTTQTIALDATLALPKHDAAALRDAGNMSPEQIAKKIDDLDQVENTLNTKIDQLEHAQASVIVLQKAKEQTQLWQYGTLALLSLIILGILLRLWRTSAKKQAQAQSASQLLFPEVASAAPITPTAITPTLPHDALNTPAVTDRPPPDALSPEPQQYQTPAWLQNEDTAATYADTPHLQTSQETLAAVEKTDDSIGFTPPEPWYKNILCGKKSVQSQQLFLRDDSALLGENEVKSPSASTPQNNNETKDN